MLSASAPGFGEQRVPEFTLTVGQAATIDFALIVGSQNEVVTVQGSAPQLDTASANLGTVVETEQVNDLPLNGRDFTHLLTLTAGISPVNNGQAGPSGGQYATPEPINHEISSRHQGKPQKPQDVIHRQRCLVTKAELLL